MEHVSTEDPVAQALRVTRGADKSDAEKCGPVHEDEAKQIAHRFINGHFNNPDRERPRISVPVDFKRDDDVRLLAFIAQAATARRIVRFYLDARERCGCRGKDCIEHGDSRLVDEALAGLGVSR